MKKRASISLALLLCLALLCGCAGKGAVAGAEGEAVHERGAEGPVGELESLDPIPFDEIEYERPTEALAALEGYVEQLRADLEAGKSLRAITDLLDRCYEAYYHVDTMYTVAEIRSDLDMTDEFYVEEYDWCYDAMLDCEEMMDDVYFLCGGSDLAEKLEKEYFWEGFAEEYSDESESMYTDRMMELMRQESELLSEYRGIVAAPTLEMDGEQVDVWEYLGQIDDYNRYQLFLMRYYREYNDDFARVFIELAKVRAAMAEEAGYDSYEQMQYEYFFERDYDPEQAARYLADIRYELAPLYWDLYYSLDVDYGYVDEDELYGILRTGAERMGGEVQEAFDFMSQYRLYDISFSEHKADKSYQTYLSEYEMPYVFMDPYTDLTDVTGFSHEFGHFLDTYVNENVYETIDVAEVFSQAMEFLMLDHVEGALSEAEREELLRIKLADVLAMYLQQGAFAAFEHRVYAMDPDTLTADILNETFLDCCDDFGFYDGFSHDYYAMSWVDITHFFEYPFYVISYPVSNDLAMQIYELEQAGSGEGLAKYREMLEHDEIDLIELAESAGLESPFAEGRIAKVAEDLRLGLAA